MHPEEASETYVDISAEDYKTRFVDGDESHLLLDVRTEEEFIEARIPNTVNVPLQDLTRQVGDVITMAGDRPVVLVCRSGRRSIMAAQILRSLGADDLILYNLDTGTKGWAMNSYPLDTGTPE